MNFLFPAERDHPCEELNASRFQRCSFCGWSGDIATGKRYDIGRDVWSGYRINGKRYERLLDWLIELELCSPS